MTYCLYNVFCEHTFSCGRCLVFGVAHSEPFPGALRRNTENRQPQEAEGTDFITSTYKSYSNVIRRMQHIFSAIIC